MEYWDESWFDNITECSNENFLRFIVYKEKCLRGAEHRKRVKTIIRATWQLYLDMSPLHVHMCYEQVVAESWLLLTQTPAPVFEPGFNIYKHFNQRMWVVMLLKSKRMAAASEQKKKWNAEMEQFLLGL